MAARCINRELESVEKSKSVEVTGLSDRRAHVLGRCSGRKSDMSSEELAFELVYERS